MPHRVSWRALLAMLRWPWDHAEYLAADAIDLLNIQVWQQTEDGRKGRNQPQPISRPGEAAKRANETESLLSVAREQGWIS